MSAAEREPPGSVLRPLRAHETFSSANNPLVGKAFPQLVLIPYDPPRHTRFRRLVNKAFTLKRIEALTPWITSVANELLDEAGTEEWKSSTAHTIPLPVKVIARLLGIPGDDLMERCLSLPITAEAGEARMT